MTAESIVSLEREAEARESVVADVAAAPRESRILGDHDVGMQQLEDPRDVAGRHRLIDLLHDLDVAHARHLGVVRGGGRAIGGE